jgi:hypothetical protein
MGGGEGSWCTVFKGKQKKFAMEKYSYKGKEMKECSMLNEIGITKDSLRPYSVCLRNS